MECCSQSPSRDGALSQATPLERALGRTSLPSYGPVLPSLLADNNNSSSTAMLHILYRYSLIQTHCLRDKPVTIKQESHSIQVLCWPLQGAICACGFLLLLQHVWDRNSSKCLVLCNDRSVTPSHHRSMMFLALLHSCILD